MLRGGLEPWHLLIVAIVIIVLFGAKKLPDTARALGKSMRILKSEAKAMKDDGGAGTAGAQPAARYADDPAETASDASAPRLVKPAPADTVTARSAEGQTAL
jgi:sec-independent protein translocase protein TatA